MRSIALFYPNLQIGQQAVAQLPWSHIILLIQKVKDNDLREWYASQCIENGWSRHALDNHLKQNLHGRQALPQVKASNYLSRLPSPQSQLAHEMLKNPYNFSFLGLHDDALEREIEHASIQHITKFLLELGKGFAFVGHQVPIEVDNEQFFIDMLFYNLKLRCFVVVEIKAGKFKPEHAGQLNFYLSAVDAQWKQAQDNPTIGLLLCKSRSKIIAEYALKDIDKPIGISEYELTKAIPEDLRPSLPSIEEIEAELNDSEDESNR
jgi:predicted nuclease of restriction endonuclease-like (RecB) superfamily